MTTVTVKELWALRLSYAKVSDKYYSVKYSNNSVNRAERLSPNSVNPAGSYLSSTHAWNANGDGGRSGILHGLKYF